MSVCVSMIENGVNPEALAVSWLPESNGYNAMRYVDGTDKMRRL